MDSFSEFKSFMVEKFPFDNYICVKQGINASIENETYYRVEEYGNPNYRKLNKYMKITDIKGDVKSIINKIALSESYCAPIKEVKETIEEIAELITNKEYKIYSDDYVVTNNGYIINVTNGHIMLIKENEHVLSNINISMVKTYNISYDPFTTLIKLLIKSILFDNKNIILEYICPYSANILVEFLKRIFTPYDGNKIVAEIFVPEIKVYTGEINIFRNKTINLLRKCEKNKLMIRDCLYFEVLNLRCKDASLQMLNSFKDYILNRIDMIFTQSLEYEVS